MADTVAFGARDFYERIRITLEGFAAEHQFSYEAWYHDQPIFLFRHYDNAGALVSFGMKRFIQVRIEPQGVQAAIISIFAQAIIPPLNFSDVETAGMRHKTIWVMRGLLPDDEDRLAGYLRVARKAMLEITEGQLLSSEEQETLRRPLFDLTPPKSEY